MTRFSKKKFAQAAVQLLQQHPRRSVVPALAQVIVSQRWRGEVATVVAEIERQLLQATGHLTLHLKSARSLPAAVERHVAAYFKTKQAATSISVQSSLDPTLVGGLVAHTAELELDLSLRRRLNQLHT